MIEAQVSGACTSPLHFPCMRGSAHKRVIVVTKRKRGGDRQEEAKEELLQLANPHTHTGPCAHGGRGDRLCTLDIGGGETNVCDADADNEDV